MTKINGSIEVREIKFTGLDVEPSLIKFEKPVQVLNGASNTGKSFLVEVIDYMLGSESIDKIKESLDYDEISMKIFVSGKPFTIYRGFPSPVFEIYKGHTNSKSNDNFLSYYKTGKATQKVGNINDFYLGEMSLLDKEVSANLFGEKSRITIRLLSRVIVTNEVKIISPGSPIEAGDRTENSKNKNVFRFLLTGIDDGKTQTITRDKEFNSEIKGRVSVLEEVISELSTDLSFPKEGLDSLKEREIKLTKSIDELVEQISEAQKGLSEVVIEKNRTAKELMQLNERLSILVVNRINFEQLSKIYTADIERLQSQEEAAFLLTAGHEGECSVCGSQSPLICDDLTEVNQLASASIAEIRKIKKKDSELLKTMNSLDRQRKALDDDIQYLTVTLLDLDRISADRAPILKQNNKGMYDLKSERNFIETDILLRQRIRDLQRRLQESELSSAPKKYSASDFYPDDNIIENFCNIYGNILKDIEFPGDHNVTFDYKRFDVVIGGNPRHLNGKGVRAILNSVFKIALLIHCREKNLFHPGLLILDSPLLTYRDPLKSKHGELNEDEKELAKSKISYRFLNYLHSISDLAQFIIIENIDIPAGLEGMVGVESFYGKGASIDERYGLFNK